MVPRKGLEPSRLAPLVPETSASTKFRHLGTARFIVAGAGGCQWRAYAAGRPFGGRSRGLARGDPGERPHLTSGRPMALVLLALQNPLAACDMPSLRLDGGALDGF